MSTLDTLAGARALLDWTQRDLAERTSISRVSIRAFEKGGDMRESNLRLLTLTFEAAGTMFQADGESPQGESAFGSVLQLTTPDLEPKQLITIIPSSTFGTL
ncbi:helix-turn-helix domain-containing protein [Rhizobium leguminosarum]|uniref:helix-turn-helix domain-containing protein n=1 Tax=Rhizobium leguminosarum TaxID=384 RepID=UPI001C97506B|nr:helix-turn-helix transcriptional regulator [Rhizobium leguminosarum]